MVTPETARLVAVGEGRPTGVAPAAEVVVSQRPTDPLINTRRRPAPSLRLRLTLWNVAILLGTLLLFSLLLYGTLAWNLEREIENSLIQQYSQIRDSADVSALYNSVTGELRLRSQLDPNIFSSREFDLFVQISSPQGEVPAGGRSTNLGETALPLTVEDRARVRQDETIIRDDYQAGRRLRILSGPLYLEWSGGKAIVGVIQVARSLERVDRTLTMLRLLLIGIGALSLLVAGLVGLVLAGATLRPLHRLAQAAREIGAWRDFRRRVPNEGPADEVGQLADTMNEMLNELAAAHRSLEQSLEMQRRFVADASHELRTPLTTIRGNVGLLRRVATVEPADREAALADIESEAERMARLINQLLSLARADAGLTLMRTAVDLDAIIHEIGRQLPLLTAASGLSTQVGPVEPTRIQANADAIKQLLLILVDNAVKYTPAGGLIRLSLTHQGQQAIIRVADSGIGIPAEHLPRIFDRFYRVDPSRSGGGSGLGLAIARWLVEMHGGRIEVDSQVSRGTIVQVWLPLAF